MKLKTSEERSQILTDIAAYQLFSLIHGIYLGNPSWSSSRASSINLAVCINCYQTPGILVKFIAELARDAYSHPYLAWTHNRSSKLNDFYGIIMSIDFNKPASIESAFISLRSHFPNIEMSNAQINWKNLAVVNMKIDRANGYLHAKPEDCKKSELYNQTETKFGPIYSDLIPSIVGQFNAIKEGRVLLSLMFVSKVFYSAVEKYTPPFQVFIRELTGRTSTCFVRSTDSVSHLHDQVEYKTGIPADLQRLIYHGMQFWGKERLTDYEVKPESSIDLILRLRGD